MSELKTLKTKRVCKDCGKPMPRAISRHYCPLKRQCKRCGKPIPKGNKKSYCSMSCYHPLIAFTCEICSKRFKGKVISNPRFCSRRCYEVMRTARIEHTCKGCGVRFRRPNCIGKPNPRFCSRKCSTKTQLRKVVRPCDHCGSPIKRQPANAKARRIYCSKKCRWAAHQPLAFNCEHCGTQFLYPQYQYRFNGAPRFCSMHCCRMFSGETGIEKKVREALESLSITYIQEHPIQHNKKNNRRGSFYFIDFFLPSHNIALEVDGVYWHRSRQDSDAKRDLFLASIGISVVRLTDQEIESADSLPDLIGQRLSIKMRR